MKNVLKSLGLLFFFGAIVLTTSCGDDDEDIIGGGDGDFTVADGVYIAGISGEELTVTNAARLTAAKVEDEGFGSQDRDGFVRAWVYLEAGTYVFADIDDQNLDGTFGGTKTTVTVDPSNADLGPDSYEVVAIEADGAPFTIANTGVYFVTFDNLTNEALLVEIGDWGILGGSVYSDACTGVGFSSNVVLTKGASSADGTTWTASGVILRNGEVKFRLNNVWKVDRRIDNTAGFGSDNGYVAFTNVGGASVDVLEDGGANVPFTDSNDGGVYDIAVNLSALGQLSATLTRTGDADACAFQPENFTWGIIGSATQGIEGDGTSVCDGGTSTKGWSTEKRLIYTGQTDGTHTWRGVFPLAGGTADNAFKFRTDCTWATKLLPTTATVTDNTEAGTITDDGDTNADGQWFVADGKSGFYYIVISTADQGATWAISIDEAEFQVIGEGSPVGNWDAGNGIAMTYNDDLASATLATGTYTTGGWKIFVNQSFDYNVGGALDGTTALEFNNSTFALDAGGDYSVTITTADGGVTYTATATLN